LFYADYSKKEREINFENTFSSGNGSADKQGNARLLLKKIKNTFSPGDCSADKEGNKGCHEVGRFVPCQAGLLGFPELLLGLGLWFSVGLSFWLDKSSSLPHAPALLWFVV